MGIDAQMFVRINAPVTDAQVKDWSYRFGSLFHHEQFLGSRDEHYHNPLERITLYEQDGDDIVPKTGETFLNVPLGGRYYGEGYERGALMTYVSMAIFLEHLIPGCEVWYGGDSSGVCAEVFDAPARERLIQHAVSVGHDPYVRYPASMNRAEHIPVCPHCDVPMAQQGWGRNGAYALFRCPGCGWQHQEDDGTTIAGYDLETLRAAKDLDLETAKAKKVIQ